jgi:cytochrome c oxidase subunit 2
LAESRPSALERPLADGIVPAEVVARTEKRWLLLMSVMLIFMLVVVVITSAFGAAHLGSHVEVVQPATLHLGGEFAESNLGTALESDGSATVRIIAQQYDFIPRCVEVPVDTPVTFRLTSADVIHGFLLPDTNVNTMVMPGFVAEVRTTFSHLGDYQMPCHEFCGLGHHGMWTHVMVVDRARFADRDPYERVRCERH